MSENNTLYVDPDEVGAGAPVLITRGNADDHNNKDVSYLFRNAPKEFHLDTSTGEITYDGPLSFLPDGMKLTVMVWDGTVETDYVYEIRYDQRPEFEGGVLLHLDEDEFEAGMPVSITGVSARDRDSEDTVAYSLVDAPVGFSIDEGTGEITYDGLPTGLPDGGMKLTVAASDGKLSAERVYELVYEFVYEKPLESPSNTRRFYVDPDEVGAGAPVLITRGNADDHNNKDVSYLFRNAPKEFHLDTSTGEITYDGPLSFLPDGMKLTVMVWDGTVETDYVYEIRYDQRPEFEGGVLLHLDEDEFEAGMPVSITGVSARDRDSEDTVAYSLVDAPVGFSIDEGTGEITYDGPISGLSDGMDLTVVASDGKLSAERVYEITYDQRPEFEGGDRLYLDPDEVGTGSPVSISGIAAHVQDNGDTVSYRLAAAPAGFSIDEGTGEITYDGPISGLSDGMDLTVVASDGKLDNSRQYTLVYDQRPEFEGSDRFYLDPDEISLPLSLPGVSAHDQDDGDTVSYSLVGAPEGFSIDEGTGGITYDGPLSGLSDGLDLTVVASDGKLDNSRQYTLVYDQRPEFEGSDRFYLDPDEISLPLSLTGVSAHDQDDGDTVSYRLVGAPEGFSIDEGTGEITYDVPLSGLSDGLGLTVVASDGRLEAERQYQITYDQRPEFEGSDRLYLDPDEISLPLSLTGVSAHDEDDGDTVSYRLVGAPEGFSIDEGTGGITYDGPLSGLSDGLGLTVVASDGRLEAERQYQITYDQRPEFEGGDRLYLDPDEVGTGSPVSISGIAAHDQDDGDTVSYRLVGAPEGFSIDEGTGGITYDGPISGLFDGLGLTVVVSDGKLAAERQYTLEYDQRPEFESSFLLYVDEDELEAGKPVSISGVSARDRDRGDTVAYRLAAAPAGFSIDEGTGEITYDGPSIRLPDGGTKLTVVASDGKLSAERIYELVYDKPLEFAGGTRLYLDPDDVGIGSPVSISGVSVEDRDRGDTVSYRLADDAPKDLSIDEATGEITYKGRLSGLPDGVKLTVVASDGKLSAERVYEITYDQRPEFEGGGRLYLDPDEVGTGSPVSISGIAAHDQDNRDTVSYRLAAAPAGFSIDEGTGEITYDGPISGLSDGMDLTVVASDGKLDNSRQYTLVYDQRPEFEGSDRFYLDPDEISLPLSLTGVSAHDQDDGDTVSYRLAGAPEGFSIDEGTGGITYDGPLSGLSDGLGLTVVVSDGKLAAERQYTLEYDQRPEFESSFLLYVDEDELEAGKPVSISGVSARDRDRGDTVAYRLAAAPAGFSIDEGTGEITYDGPSIRLPDGGTKLTVVASDGKLSAERIYELVYDKPLEFAGGTRLYLDPDDVGIGSPVSISGVSVEDRDRGDTVSYRLADDAPKDLSIDEATGEITYKGRLSGLPDGVKLTVVASDGKLSAERVYEITYDQRPEFEGGGRLYLDPDEVGTGSPVSISGIAAHDQDNRDTVSYRLAAAPAGFSIDEGTGEITYDGPISGLSDGMDLTVVASDGKLDNSRQYTLVYDQRPEFEGSDRFYLDPDEISLPLSLTGVSAHDQDDGDTVSYRLAGAPEGFSIDEGTGEITYDGPLSGLSDGLDLTVVASDGKLDNSRQYTLVYDQRPEFEGSDRLYLDPDEISLPLSLPGVSAHDQDNGDTVSYRLAGAPEGFSIDEGTGEITYDGPLSGLSDGLGLTVVASDGRLEAERQYQITYDQRPEFEGGDRLYLDPDEVGTGSPVSISGIAAHDQDNRDTVSYRLAGAPEGFSIDEGTGEITYDGPLSGLSDGLGLTVVASDGRLEAERQYQITYDQRPEFEGSDRLYLDPDEVGTGSPVSISGIAAHDQDNGDTVSYRLAAAPEGFSIDEGTGEITYDGPISGLSDGLGLTVVASDGRLEAERQYQITYDRRPEFSADTPTEVYFDPDDKPQAGQSVISFGYFGAIDPEGDSISYSIASHPEGFAVTDQGELTYQGNLADLTQLTELEIIASDGELSTSHVVTVTEYHRPDFEPDQLTDIFIDDNTSPSRLAQFASTDEDPDNTITYSVALSDGTETDQFLIDRQGNLSLAVNASDINDNTVLKITADNGTLAITKTMKIYKRDLESDVDEAAYHVLARDLSGLLNNELGLMQGAVSYQIRSGNDNGFFFIDQTNGHLLANGLDYETRTEHLVEIVVRQDGRIISVPVRINVQDVYEGFVINNADIVMMVTKNSGSDSYVGTVQATSLDGVPMTFSFFNPLSTTTIIGNIIDNFKIDSQTGVVRTKRSDISQGLHTLSIWISDGTTARKIETKVIVGLRGSQHFDDSISFSIAENAASGTFVGDVQDPNPIPDSGTFIGVPTDDKPPLPYQFSIVSGNSDGAFSIDNSSGRLYVNGLVDYEANDRGAREIVVKATNGFDLKNITVNINVADVNEAPVFSNGLSFAVAADFEQGDRLFNVGAYDEEDSDLTYEIIQNSHSDLYSITDEGEIIAIQSAATAGISPGDISELSVRASDGINSTVRTISIKADSGAVLSADEIQGFTIQAYRGSEGQTVGTVQVEAGPDAIGALTYEIVAGNDNGLFTINHETGLITTTGLMTEGISTVLIGVRQEGEQQYTPIVAQIEALIPEDQKPLTYTNQVVLLHPHEYLGRETYIGQVVALKLGGGALRYELASDDTDELQINQYTGEIYANRSSLSKTTYPVVVRDPLNNQVSTVNFHITRDRNAALNWIVNSGTGYPEGVFVRGVFAYYYNEDGVSYFGGDDRVVVAPDDIVDRLGQAYEKAGVAREQAKREAIPTQYRAVFDAGENAVERIYNLANNHSGIFKLVLKQAFGTKVTDQIAEQLTQRVLDDELPLPAFISVINGDLSGNDGAYSETDGGTIYIRESILGDEPAVIESILLEEIGHHLDHFLGGGDAAGDEGDIFAGAIMSGYVLSEAELANKRAENDDGLILDGLTSLDVEFGTWTETLRLKLSNTSGLRRRPLRPGNTETSESGDTTYRTLNVENDASEDVELTTYSGESASETSGSAVETSFTEGVADDLVAFGEGAGESLLPVAGAGTGVATGVGVGGVALGAGLAVAGILGLAGTAAIVALAFWKHFKDEKKNKDKDKDDDKDDDKDGDSGSILDLVNSPPVFDDAAGDTTIYIDSEWTASASAPRTLINVHATDKDGDTLSYSVNVVADNGEKSVSNDFDIDQATGDLRLINDAGAIPDNQELSIEVSDVSHTVSQVVLVDVDQPPQFAAETPSTVYVDPDELSVDVPLVQVHADDGDTGDEVVYELRDPVEDFSIDSSSGAINYSGSALVDGTTLTIVASDGKFTTEHQLMFSIDQRPEFTAEVPTGIVLDTTASQIGVSQVFDFFTATDADGDLLRYEFLGDAQGFSIDTSTGTLTFAGDAGTVAADAVLNIKVTDYDTGGRERRADDDTPGQPKLDSQHQVSIYKADLSGYILENENTDILDVSSLIPSGATAQIEGDGSDRFLLENGVLRPVEPFDYEMGLTEFSLQLLIDDSSDHIIAPLTINVRDVDEPPAFSPNAPLQLVYDPYAVPIREGSPVVLGRGYTAIDPDDGATAPTYSFTIVRNDVETQTDDLSIDAGGLLLYSGVNGLGDDIDTLRITASSPVLSELGDANSTQISVVMTADHRPAFVAAEAGSKQSYYVYYDRDNIDPSTSSPVQIGEGFRAVDPDASDNDPLYSFQEVEGAGLASDSTNFSIDNEGRLFYIGTEALPETVKAIRITARDTSWPGEQLDNSETTVEVPLYSGFERTDAWGDKFIYGAWSTLISSYLLGVEFNDILPLMNDIHANSTQLRERIDAYIQRYQSLTEQEVKDIITYANSDLSGSIYEEERSVIATPEQNAMFMQAMHQHPELSPIDNILGESGFTSTNIQFNAHRSGYNNAFGIPQNSMAAVLNAYVAGIRNVEWDILTTADGVSVVSHDLATNRLTGDYFNVRQMIEQSTYEQVKDTGYTILNPLSAAPEYISSGIKLHTSADMMAFINEYTPEMVSYIDARNDAPIAFAQLLNSVPGYKEKAVIKVYPFTLGGGVDQFADKYATQYTSGDLEQARQQLSDVNVLLVFTVREFNENVLDDTSLELQDLIDAGIPYRVGSTDSGLQFDGQDIFTEEQLESIQTKTQIAIEGIAGYAARMNVQVIQYAAHWPLSLLTQNPVTDDTRAIFNGLSDDRKLRAAVTANVTYLIDKIKTGDLTATPSLEGRFDDVSYGFSDRYPDYHFAERDADGNVGQGILNHYYYEVVRGKVEVKNSEGAMFMRDSYSLLGQLMSRDDYRYITTDLPTDLRLGYMGLLGKEGIPDRILYHPAGLIKERYTPHNLSDYTPPAWTTPPQEQGIDGAIDVMLAVEENTPFSFDFASTLPTNAGEVTYSINEGDTSMFQLGSNGVLTAAQQFDYETQSSHAVSITATNSDTDTSYTERLVIEVLDVDERVEFVATQDGSRQSYYVYYDRESVASSPGAVQIGAGFKAIDTEDSTATPAYTYKTVNPVGVVTVSTDFTVDSEGLLFYSGTDALLETADKLRVTATVDGHSSTVEVPLYSGFERTDAWGDKFIYGAWSTLISSYLLGVEFNDILPLMNDIHANSTQLRERIDAYIQRYQSLTEQEVKDIITYANSDLSGSIYEEERSVIATPEQNAMFMQAMHQHPELSPIDNILGESGFTSTNIQFNAHRSGYNNAFGIPQNSMAAVLNAYVAGIRNVEWDILTTADGVSVVSHDLATNRLTGDYFNVRQMIEQSTYEQVKDTGYTILNPLSAAPEYISSGIKLHTSADMMAFINEYTPEMVSYIDARNDAPIAFAQLLNSVPGYKEKAVIKIYPFTLGGGADQFIDKYATQYTSGDLEQAKQQLSDINILLVSGEREFTGDVLDDTSLELQDLIDAGIPYRVGSTDSGLQFDGQDIFTEEQLESIQTKTQILFEAIAGFAIHMSVSVLQYATHWPLSLLTQNPVTDETRAIFNGMSTGHRENAALLANISYLLDAAKAGNLTSVPSLDGRFNGTVLGMVDRYSDLAFAEREESGDIAQGSVRDYYYDIVRGKVKTDESEFAMARRDSIALLAQLQSRNDYQYITTDIPTDLRLAYMGFLGKEGIPDRILYHPAGLIKERHNPEDLNNYQFPAWTTPPREQGIDGAIDVMLAVEENTPFSFDFAATLPTNAGEVTYSINEGDTSMFQLGSNGVLTAAQQFDYETQSSHAVSITATNSDTDTSYTERLVIEVLDEAETEFASRTSRHVRPEPQLSKTASLPQLITAMATFGPMDSGLGSYPGDRSSSVNTIADITALSLTV